MDRSLARQLVVSAAAIIFLSEGCNKLANTAKIAKMTISSTKLNNLLVLLYIYDIILHHTHVSVIELSSADHFYK